jgi:hypothetical protein
VPVDHRLEAVDFMIRASRGAIANLDQAENAERAVDRLPAIDDAAEEITPEQRHGGALRLNQGQEYLEAVIRAKPLGGESFALGKAANDTPKSRHGRVLAIAYLRSMAEFWRNRQNWRRSGCIVGSNHHRQEL